MADQFQLEDNEVVITQADNICYNPSTGPAGMFQSKQDTLVLTSKNLILVQKNLFGKAKNTLRFPLSSIRVADGKVQVMLGKPDIVTHTLDVYFNSGLERFAMPFEDDVREWIASITETVTGVAVPRKDPDAWMAETLAMADAFAGTVKKVKGALGIHSDEEMSAHCPGCGASLTGQSGQTVECAYCGTYYTFQEE